MCLRSLLLSLGLFLSLPCHSCLLVFLCISVYPCVCPSLLSWSTRILSLTPTSSLPPSPLSFFLSLFHHPVLLNAQSLGCPWDPWRQIRSEGSWLWTAPSINRQTQKQLVTSEGSSWGWPGFLQQHVLHFLWWGSSDGPPAQIPSLMEWCFWGCGRMSKMLNKLPLWALSLVCSVMAEPAGSPTRWPGQKIRWA